MLMENPLELRDRAVIVAKEVGAVLLDHFGRAQAVEQKSRTDFRTRADTESDLRIRRMIAVYYPDHRVNSEEAAAKTTSSPYRWVVDPLDGTTGFVLGDWNWCVAIGVFYRDDPIVGVILAPKRGELYSVVSGSSATLNRRTIRVANETNLNRAIIALEPGKAPGREMKAVIERRLLANDGARITVSWASAAVSLAAVAAGNLNGFIGHKLEPWDMAAAVPILRAAGAKVTNIAGDSWKLQDESIVAANPVLHAQLIDLVQQEWEILRRERDKPAELSGN